MAWKVRVPYFPDAPYGEKDTETQTDSIQANCSLRYLHLFVFQVSIH